MAGRNQLQIGRLDTIQGILNSYYFLGYSTQLRNLAYLIQLKQFLSEIYEYYEIDRGIGVMYRYNLLKCNADIIEALLFCGLRSARVPIPADKSRAMKYIQVSKRFGLITKPTAKEATIVIEYRNNFHPEKQTELHLSIDMAIFTKAETIIPKITEELKRYFLPRDQNGDYVLCWEHGITIDILPAGEPCPFCHGLLI